MTDSHVPEPTMGAEDVTVHVLRSAPPTRALLVAALGSVVGAILLVLSAANGWSVVVTVLAVIILGAGLVLLGLAVWTVLKMQVRAELTPTGYTFRTPSGVRHGTWAETVKVTASESGRRISLYRRDDSVQHVLCPVGAEDRVMQQLVGDLAERLKSSRG